MICPNPACARNLPMIGLLKLSEPRYVCLFLFFGPKVLWAPHTGNIWACPACSHRFGLGPDGVFRPSVGHATSEATLDVPGQTNGPDRDREQERTREAMRSRGPMVPKEPPGW